jgi:16S rRNA (adenine1518-N6/adenine1519-N6)-dimethyltransferase
MPGQRLGQNFLSDPAWRARISRRLPLGPDTWLEIGAGHGEMTELLARHAARVLAIELDAQLGARLRQRAAAWPGVEIYEGDVLKLLPRLLPESGARVYGNLPYYLTSPILHLLFRFARRIQSAHLVMQWEVAARVTATPGRRAYGYLSVASQCFSHPALVLRIPAGAFRPRPKVTSALVEMKFPGVAKQLGLGLSTQDPSSGAFLRWVQVCFAQKRKTLANNLRSYFATDSNLLAYIPELLRQADVSPRARAEALSVEQFATLFRAWKGRTAEACSL